ncbi:H-type small acid-soluble spore protein [Metabacillus malikii]|uniref:Small, acid-soluble spore protein H n=2 Tax=Metabacillus malikii TaxID=1504265 RepID=A0ABT9ZAP1_9BACI|nr:H-type small acid-soluble spore protein [Metabacillus malikii]
MNSSVRFANTVNGSYGYYTSLGYQLISLTQVSLYLLLKKETLIMDAKRAQEISSSPEMASVMYKGNQVYIEHVDQDKELATIHPLENPSKKQSVSVTNLVELSNE